MHRPGTGAGATPDHASYPPEVELAWLGRDGVITAVNEAWRDFCVRNDGDPGACGPGASYLAVCDADPGAAAVGAAIRAQLAGERRHPAVFTVPCDAPHSTRWYDVHVSPRLGDTDDVEGVVVAVVAVTRSQPGLPADLPVTDLVEGAPDGAVLVDAGGIIRYVNSQLLTLTGHPRSALLGERVELLVPEGLRPRHQGWREGYQQASRGRPMGTGASLTLQRRDGSQVPVEISLTPVTVGDTVMTFASIRDVSEIRAQDHARRRLLRLLDLDPEAVYVIDAETAHIEYANSGACELLGYTRDELLAMSLYDVTVDASEDRRRSIMAEHERAGQGHVHMVEVVRQAKDGTRIPCDTRGQLVVEPDGPRKFIIVDRDARGRLEAERQRARQSELSALVAEVAQMVLSDAPRTEVLQHVVSGAATLLDSQNSSIVAYDPATDRLETLAAVGPAATLHLQGVVRLDRATVRGWMAEHRPVTVAAAPSSMPSELRERTGPGVVVRMPGTGRPLGLLTTFRAAGGAAFTETESRLLGDLARQVTLALELGSARATSQRLELVEERQRIARDLHDTVIQDLIGIGMQLAAPGLPGSRESVVHRDNEIVRQLDDTIRRLRLIVFDARTERLEGTVSEEIRRTIREAARTLDHRPHLSVEGDVDDLADALVQHLISVLREGLSNVARHASASATEVRVTVTPESIEVLIQDNGCGLGDRLLHGTGTASLRERAEMASGSLSLADRPEGGARLTWTAPRGTSAG
jgi:PAS domain S-box-containing protein